MKKSNKKILDLPFGDNEFEIVDADEYIDTIYMATTKNEKTRLSRNSAVNRNGVESDSANEVTFYWQAHRQIPVNDKLNNSEVLSIL